MLRKKLPACALIGCVYCSFSIPYCNLISYLFSSLDKGVLHKSVVFEGEVHIVEEIQLLKKSESIKNLLLSSEVSYFTVTVSNCSNKETTATQELENVFCKYTQTGSVSMCWYNTLSSSLYSLASKLASVCACVFFF